MLQQATVLPALSAADAFHVAGIHQISAGGSRKAVAPGGHGRTLTEAQLFPQRPEAFNQPPTGLLIRLLPLSGRLGPDQRVGETAGMKHRLAATGPPHQRELAACGQVVPVRGPPVLIAAQGEPGATPAIKTQNGIAWCLIQQQLIQGHLLVAARMQQRQEPTHRTFTRHAGGCDAIPLCWICLGGIFRS